jgi:hypothetical protein
MFVAASEYESTEGKFPRSRLVVRVSCCDR